MNRSEAADTLMQAIDILHESLTELGFPFNCPAISDEDYDDDNRGFKPYWLSANYYSSENAGEIRMTGGLYDIPFPKLAELVSTIHTQFPNAGFKVEGMSVNRVLMRFDYNKEGVATRRI